MSDRRQLAAEEYARRFHEAYERLAPSFGYETRKDSAVPWEDVPEPNRSLMIAVAAEVVGPALDALEAANKQNEYGMRVCNVLERKCGEACDERDRLAVVLQNLADDWRTSGRTRRIARSALAGGGHEEPEQQEQDLGTTASQSSVVKGEEA